MYIASWCFCNTKNIVLTIQKIFSIKGFLKKLKGEGLTSVVQNYFD